MKLTLLNYGKVIATDTCSEEVYNEIRNGLDRDEDVIIDAKGVAISKKASRLIFGRLYKEIKDKFDTKVKFINNDTLFTYAVNTGIFAELDN